MLLQNSKLFLTAAAAVFFSMSAGSFGMRRLPQKKHSLRRSILTLNVSFSFIEGERGQIPHLTLSSPSSIKTIGDFESLQEYLKEQTTEKTLVIFDFDEVLFIPKNHIHLSKNKIYIAEQMKFEKENLEDPDLYRRTEEQLRKDAVTLQPIDEEMVNLVRCIQDEKKAKTMVLTAGPIGRMDGGLYETWEDFRIQHLEKYDFHFDNSWPEDMNGTYRCLDITGDRTMEFKNGVLFSNDYSKGYALEMFFRKYHYTRKDFNKIIMVDDGLDNLESVKEVCLRRLGVGFFGVHYTKNDSFIMSQDDVEEEIQWIVEDQLDDDSAALQI